jgi:hypothetical protein
MASKCSYHITTIQDKGGDTVVVHFYIDEGDITTVTEALHNSDGISENVSVTRYRPTGILQQELGATFTSAGYIAELNRYLAANFVTGSRTAISEQAV